MAYLPTANAQPYQDDDELKPPVLSGEGGTIQAGGSPSLSTAPATPPGSGEGTGFVDLRRYLDENRGKTAGLSDRIGGDVEGKAGEVESSIDEGASIFDTTAREMNTVDPEFVKSTLADPIKAVEDPLNVDRFGALRTGTYRGPGSLGTDPYTGNITEAQTMAGQTQTAEGLEDLMSGYSSDPTKGKTGLNQALLGQSTYAQDRFDAAQDRTTALTDYLSGAVSASEATAGQLADELSAYAPEVQKAMDARATAFNEDLGSQYESAIIEALNRINEPIYLENLRRHKQTEAYRGGTVDDDTEWKEGDIAGELPSPYYYDAPATRNVWAASTPDSYALERALEALAGQKYDYLPDTAPGQDDWQRRVAYLEGREIPRQEVGTWTMHYGDEPYSPYRWDVGREEREKNREASGRPPLWDLGV
jgi:hypothetical protein